jgi:tellurite resistance protein TerC
LLVQTPGEFVLLLAAKTAKSSSFVNIEVPGWAWLALVGLLLALLAVDLVRHREAKAPTPAEALRESLGWVACGLSFSVVIWISFGGPAFTEYLSGYVIEKSLSVDNVFVWSLVFSAMAIPLKFQHRVLFWGIFGALVLRAIFIFAGTALIAKFSWLLIVFGVFLVFTGLKILREGEDDSDPDDGHLAKTPGLGLLRRVMPVTDTIEGKRFFTLVNAKRAATPLLAALVVVELTDVIFAVDSVPAVLAVSHEPFLVFASNAFAILGLRAMYFLLADAKERFHYLPMALGVILVLVGLKMIAEHWIAISTVLSLALIVTILTIGVLTSQQRTKRLAAADKGPQ